MGRASEVRVGRNGTCAWGLCVFTDDNCRMEIEGSDAMHYAICKFHSTVYLDGFAVMPINRVLELKGTDEDFNQTIAQAERVRKSGVQEFKPEDVMESHQSHIVIKRKFTILNEKEFRGEMQNNPTVRVTRGIPIANVPCERNPGELEKVFLMKYEPDSPYRELSLTTGTGCVKRRKIMDFPQHLYARQGYEFMEWSNNGIVEAAP